MDALSSQANVAGYRAALIGAQELGALLPDADDRGRHDPARPRCSCSAPASPGLQAIATARRLGAVVTGFDVRSAVKEQVESLGAQFLELEVGGDAEGEGGYARELTDEEQAAPAAGAHEAIAKFDVVITTALVPGRPRRGSSPPTPCERMKPGLGDRRPRRRGGRQLRAHRARRDRRRARRDDRRPAQPARHDGRARLPALRAQRPGAARADDRRGRRARRSTSTTRSSPAPASRATARSSTRAPRPRPAPPLSQGPHELVTEIAILVLAGVRRLRGHLEGPEHAAHAADVRHQRDPRHRRARRPARDRPQATGTLNKLLLVIAIAFGTINVVGGFLVTDRMLEMFKGKQAGEAADDRRRPTERGQGRVTVARDVLPAGPGLHQRPLHRRLLAVHPRAARADAARAPRCGATRSPPVGMAIAVVATLLTPGDRQLGPDHRSAW